MNYKEYLRFACANFDDGKCQSNVMAIGPGRCRVLAGLRCHYFEVNCLFSNGSDMAMAAQKSYWDVFRGVPDIEQELVAKAIAKENENEEED